MKKFIWRKLFLSSNPSIPYFIWNFWSKESPPLDQIISNSFEYYWIIHKGYYSFGPAQGHRPMFAKRGPCARTPLPPLLPRTVPPDPRPSLSAGRCSRPTTRRPRKAPLLHTSRPCHQVPHPFLHPALWTRPPSLPLFPLSTSARKPPSAHPSSVFTIAWAGPPKRSSPPSLYLHRHSLSTPRWRSSSDSVKKVPPPPLFDESRPPTINRQIDPQLTIPFLLSSCRNQPQVTVDNHAPPPPSAIAAPE
jgi:hypothetical protein